MYLSTALKREANSRGCRCTNIEGKSSEKPLRSSLGFWITCCEDFGPFLRAFWEHFAPQSVSRNGKKNRSDFGGVPGGSLVDPGAINSAKSEAGGWPGKYPP